MSSTSKDDKKHPVAPSSERNGVCDPNRSSVCDESVQTMSPLKSLIQPSSVPPESVQPALGSSVPPVLKPNLTTNPTVKSPPPPPKLPAEPIASTKSP